MLVNTNFAAGLTDASGHVMNGPVSWLAYAYRFFGLPMGVFGVAIASAALPRLARSAAVADLAQFRDTLSRSVVMILLLTVPASVGLALLGESMIAIVYQHGRFLAYDTHQTALALSCYAAGLAAYAGMKLIAPAFYALGDARTPAIVSLASVLVNVATAFTMVRVFGFGPAGLALSTSVVATFSAVSLLLILRGKIGGIHGGALAASGLKILLAAGAMGFVCWAVIRGSHTVLAGSSARMADIALGIPASAGSFYAAATLLRIPELVEARASVLRRLRGVS
jgi:putative peptidoglycan lipid II flippase